MAVVMIMHSGWPNQNLVQEIYHEGCHLVAKRPKGDGIPNQEKKLLWRYSFSAAEKKLFRQDGHDEESSCRKQVLRILKALRDVLHLEPVKSYHLKTMFLYECEAYPLSSQWSSDHLGKRFMGLLQRLENCLRQSNCPHYFIKHLNLFKTFTHKRCHDLAEKVHEIRLQPEEMFTSLILKSLQQAVEQSLMQALEQAMDRALAQTLEKALHQDRMHRLDQALEEAAEQAVEQAVEQALKQSQGQVQEQSLEQALGVLQHALGVQAEALEEGLEHALVQELEQEPFEQVLGQAILEGQIQAQEQALRQAMGKAMGRALGQAMGQNLGQALGHALGNTLVQALQIILEQSLEQLASFFHLFTYYFILLLCAIENP